MVFMACYLLKTANSVNNKDSVNNVLNLYIKSTNSYCMGTKTPCSKCGKEVDARGIRLHEKNCKGNQQPPAQSGTSIRSEIKVKKQAPPAQKPTEKKTEGHQQPKSKSIWDHLNDIFDE